MKNEKTRIKRLIETDHQLNSLQACINSLQRTHSSKKHVIWWTDIGFKSSKEKFHEKITQTFNYLNEKIKFNWIN